MCTLEDKVFDLENDVVILRDKIEKLEATIDNLTRVIQKIIKVNDLVTNLYVEGKRR